MKYSGRTLLMIKQIVTALKIDSSAMIVIPCQNIAHVRRIKKLVESEGLIAKVTASRNKNFLYSCVKRPRVLNIEVRTNHD